MSIRTKRYLKALERAQAAAAHVRTHLTEARKHTSGASARGAVDQLLSGAALLDDDVDRLRSIAALEHEVTKVGKLPATQPGG